MIWKEHFIYITDASVTLSVFCGMWKHI